MRSAAFWRSRFWWRARPFLPWIAGVSARVPQTRDIHIEAYRYGFSPARVTANRRDWTDLIDKKNRGKFSIYAAVVWVVCLGVLPALWYLPTRLVIWIGRSSLAAGSQFRVTSAALVPIGLACWIAFALLRSGSITGVRRRAGYHET